MQTAAPLSCDTLIMAATDAEWTALSEVASRLSLSWSVVPGSAVEYRDLGRPGVSRVYAVRTEIGPLGYGGSAARAIACRSQTGATSLICLGMAFGVDHAKQDYGDVLVSSSLIPYDSRMIMSDCGLPKESFHKVKRFATKPYLQALLERERDRVKRPYKVHVGALLTGAAHISCGAYRTFLVKKCGKAVRLEAGEEIIGGEMEGGGLLSVSDPADPVWIVVKGISDFADEDRDSVIKANRAGASENAVELVLSALKNEGTLIPGTK